MKLMELKNYYTEYKHNGKTYSNPYQIPVLLGMQISDDFVIDTVKALLPAGAKPIGIAEICGDLTLDEIETIVRQPEGPCGYTVRIIYLDVELYQQYMKEVAAGDMS